MLRRPPHRPHWHPLSTLLIDDPLCFATESLLRMLLDAAGEQRLIYSGDRMWPAVENGASFTVVPHEGDLIPPGSAVVVCPSGIPDLLRVESHDASRVIVSADADPNSSTSLPHDAVVARARLPRGRASRSLASSRRLRLEFLEAWRGRPDPRTDPADTVRQKYESQANFYARTEGPDIDPRLLERLRRHAPEGKRVLVVGSGAGRECFGLAREGWPVTGIEFSPAMVERSRDEAERRGLQIDFRLADIRRASPGEASLGAVLFTYDVYSFIPWRAERIEVLRRIRSWLGPAGVVFLSARHVHTLYERALLGLHWLSRQRRGETCDWGDSHSRWIADDGTLRRSFVHVFSEPQIGGEIAAAGFAAGPWEGGHCVLEPASPDIIRG